jgi:hypothetical protein
VKVSFLRSIIAWIVAGLVIGLVINVGLRFFYVAQEATGTASAVQLSAIRDALSFAADKSSVCSGQSGIDYYFREENLPPPGTVNRVDLPAQIEIQAVIGWRCDYSEARRLIREEDRFREFLESDFENLVANYNDECQHCLLMLRMGYFPNDPIFNLATGDLYEYTGPDDKAPYGIPSD